MKRTTFAAAVALLVAPLAVANAQYYGVVDNFQGQDRYPDFINLTSKTSAAANNFNFSGGGGGFGAGELADGGPAGTGDKCLDGGGALGGGFAGFSTAFNTAINLGQVSNGRTNTGISVSFMDQQNNGDVWTMRIDAPDFSNSKTFTLPVTSTAWATYNFNLATDGVTAGAYNPANVTAIVFAPASDNGNFAFRIDNIALTGNYVPTSGNIEDFQAYAPATLAAAAGALANPNNFDGAVETFVFGAGAVTAASLVDLGAGNIAGRWTFSTTESGIVFDLGLPGAQADLSAFTAVELDLSVGEAGDEVFVDVEDVNAPTFASRCNFTPAATTTMQTFTIPFTSLTCGTQGLTKSKIHRVSILSKTDQGNGITVTVDNVRFVSGGSAVPNWDMYR